MLAIPWLLATGCGPNAAAVPSAYAPPSAPSLSTTPTSACALKPGLSKRTVTVDGQERHYLVNVGTQLALPPPVLFMWHGYGGNATQSMSAVEPDSYWQDSVVVAPTGLPRSFGRSSRPGWQTRAGEMDDRDLAFFDAVLAELTQTGCVDNKRVYTTGFSNGGFFSNLLACERGDVLAAAAPVSGGGPPEGTCGAAVPIMITHGTLDLHVFYNTGRRSYQHWRDHNGCTQAPEPGRRGCFRATCADAPVQLCSWTGGHWWSRVQSARTADFLRQFSRP